MFEKIVKDGDEFRRSYVQGFDAFIQRLNNEGYAQREAFMPIEGFAENIEKYRRAYHTMLGLDKIPAVTDGESTMTKIGEDEDAEIFRVTFPIVQEIPMQGLLFVPHGTECAPLIIAQHGGGGTPELCADMNGKNNYNHMVRRLLRRGAIVFAPQLLLWNQKEPLPTQPVHAVPYDRAKCDIALKRFGMSITALEIKGIMNAITVLSALPYVAEDKIGMIGISYGGYFTLHTMAADTRIRAGFSNACFNDRNNYPWLDWTYKDSGNTFQDAEVAALCAPRKLYIAVGKDDAVFSYQGAVSEIERAKKYFDACGCAESLRFLLWDGGHTLPNDDEGLDFLFSAFE